MPKISPEKRKQYNQAYRAKQKEQIYLDPPHELPAIEIEKIYMSPPPSPVSVTNSLEDSQADSNIVTLDRETYEYLIKNFKSTSQEDVEETVEKTEEKKTEKPIEKDKEEDDSFFYMLLQQSKVAVASTLPLLALKLMMTGVQSTINLTALPTTTQPKDTQESSAQPSALRQVSFEL